MSKILYITEKSSQIEALEKGLKDNRKTGHRVEPLAGHILRMKDFKEYNSVYEKDWNTLIHEGKVPFFPEKIEKVISEKSKGRFKTDYKKIFKKVKDSIDWCDNIILATDPDNEGVTLGMEVIEACGALHKVKGMINMSKLDAASMKKEVMITNKIPYNAMYGAGVSRAFFDQVFGFNVTMFSTEYLNGGTALQVGGVSLPLLRMIVDRDLAFENHTKTPYWVINAKCRSPKGVFDVKIKYDKEGKISTKSKAEEIKALLSVNNKFVLNNFEHTEKKKKPPKPFDLQMIKSHSKKKFKCSLDKAEAAVEKAYEEKIGSYPRVETSFYAEGEFLLSKNILTKLYKTSAVFKDAIKHIVNPLIKRKDVFNDKGLEGQPHTALTPTEDLNKTAYDKLDELERNVFTEISLRYIMQFADDYTYKSTIFLADYVSDPLIQISAEEQIGIKGKEGWKNIDKDELAKIKYSETIPMINPGETLTIVENSIDIKQEFTSPKPRFTEVTIEAAMKTVHLAFDDPDIKKHLKENGIGTPATRKHIVQKCFDQKYLVLEKGKIISTKKARDLIGFFPKNISSPKLRADLEAGLKMIVQGKLSEEDYMKQIVKIVNDIIEKIKTIGTFKRRERVASKTTPHICPMPSCSKMIVDNGSMYKCEDNRYSKGKVTGCKFSIFKNQKFTLGRDFTETEFTDFLAGKEIETPKGNIKFVNEPKRHFVELVGSVTATPAITHSDGIKENGKAYIKDKVGIVYKSIHRRDISLEEAREILDGKIITITCKKKDETGSYKLKVKLNKKTKKVVTEFA